MNKENQFSEQSLLLNSKISKINRQKEGMFFTPLSIRKRLFEKVAEFLQATPDTILEPSFGSGEFLTDAKIAYPKAHIYGVEKNTLAFNTVKNTTVKAKRLTLLEGDFLEFKSEIEFPLIIGNPPFFVVKTKNKECMIGRGNIFVLFIYKCLTDHLADGGILAFVLPTSFYNCCYYAPCRDFISKNTTILHVENLDGAKFYETGQNTMLLILKKEPAANSNFLWNGYITPFYTQLETLLVGSTTFKTIGLKVKTGDVVWNQHKDALTNNPDKGKLVIYTTNLVNNQLVLNNLKGDEKGQYISNFEKEPIIGPAFLISRGFGNAYKFSYVFIENGVQFHGENHINVISSTKKLSTKTWQTIRDSLDSDKTSEFIRMLIGNGAISKTELETIFPLWI